jgi:hypothetical protein
MNVSLTDRELSRSMAKGVSREVGTSRNRKLNNSSSTPPNVRIKGELDTYAQGQLAKMYVG